MRSRRRSTTFFTMLLLIIFAVGGYFGIKYINDHAQKYVYFNTNGGNSIAAVAINGENAVDEPTDPTKTGYDFKGWYIDKNYTSLYDFSTIPTQTITLYAKWEPKTFLINYYDDLGSFITSYTVIYGQPGSVRPVDAKKGYDGYWVDESGNKFDEVKISSALSNMNLYEKYDKKVYTITFLDNNGDVIVTEHVKYQESATAPNPPTLTGYTFNKWDTDFLSVEDDLTIRAIFDINYYDVTFLNSDGTTIETRSIVYGSEIPTDISYATITGSDFICWVQDGTDNKITKIEENITLKAKYDLHTYTITFCDYDGTVLSTQGIKYQGSATAPTSPTRGKKYKFNGWDADFSNITQDLTINAVYLQIKCTITFNSNNGASSSSTLVDFDTGVEIGSKFPVISAFKINYVLGDWTINQDGTGDIVDELYIPTQDITVYADWYEQINANWVISDNMVIGYTGTSNKVSLPTSATIVGNGNSCLTGLCKNPNNYEDDPTNPKTPLVTDIIIPTCYTKVNNKAFYNVFGINNVRFLNGSNCTEIGDYAFASNADFTSIALDHQTYNSTTQKYEYDYTYYSIKAIKLPKSISKISSYAFFMSTNLQKFSIESDCPNFKTKDGILYNADFTELILCPTSNSNTTVVIPKTVMKIDDYAFACGGRGGNTASINKVESILFEAGSLLKTIGNFAFVGCGNLKNIDFSNVTKLESIGEAAFNSCGIENVNLSNCTTLNSIGKNAFLSYYKSYYSYSNYNYMNSYNLYYSKLKTIDISKSIITTINEGTFYNSTSLTSISLPSTLTTINKFAFYNSALQNISLPTSLTTINEYAFSYSKLTSLTLKDNIATCGVYSFYNCSKLTDVSISNKLSVIESNMFYACSSLVNVSLNNGVTTIKDYAFRDCTTLKTINITKNVSTIYSTAFYNTSLMESFTTDSENTSFISKDNGVLYTLDLTELVEYPENRAGETYEILSTTKIIRDYSFNMAKNVKTITFASTTTLTNVGSYSFEASIVETIVLPTSVISINSYAFNNCSKLSNSGSFVMPTALQTIGDYAFSNTLLTGVTFNENLTSIGNHAFVGSISGNLFLTKSIKTLGQDCFNSSLISTIEVEDGSALTSFSYECFYNCKSLTSLTYLGSCAITSYDGEAFYGDKLLTDSSKFIMPDSLTNLGYSCFYGTGFESITLGKNISSIYAESSSTYYSRYYNALYTGKLKTIAIQSGGNTEFNVINGILYKNADTLYYCPECIVLTGNTLNVAGDVTTVYYSAFAYNNTISVVNFTSLGDVNKNGLYNGAFYCSNITTVKFGTSTIKSICGSTFYGCSKLVTVDFGTNSSNLESISIYSFYGCTSLKTITIPTNITSIESQAFYNTGLTSVYLPSKVVPPTLGSNNFNSTTRFKIKSNCISIYSTNTYWKSFAKQFDSI